MERSKIALPKFSKIPNSTPLPKLSSSLVEDAFDVDASADLVSFADDGMKQWKIKNDGDRDWPTDTVLAFIKGDTLGDASAAFVAPGPVKVGAVKSGEEVQVQTCHIKVCINPFYLCILFAHSDLGAEGRIEDCYWLMETAYW